jgi:hypothetical protein
VRREINKANLAPNYPAIAPMASAIMADAHEAFLFEDFPYLIKRQL